MKLDKFSKLMYVKHRPEKKNSDDFYFFKRFYKTFDENLLKIDQSDSNADEQKKTKYIFIRLYDPVYKYPVPTVLLQKGIGMTNVNEINVSHAAIGFDLTDRFYGLSFGGKYNLKIEQCTAPEGCNYMATCNPEKSMQYTFAIPVTAAEYDSARKLTLRYFGSKNLRYTVMHNIPMALYSIQRKFFSSELHFIDYEQFLEIFKAEFNMKHTVKLKEKFVCSTFCSFILMSSVPSVSHYFNEKGISFNYVMPGDLTAIPDLKLLFSSTWMDFKTQAKKYAAENPEFLPYL